MHTPAAPSTSATSTTPARVLGVVIVSWNGRELLARSLDTLLGSTSSWMLDVVVVDNASTDGSVELVRERWPRVAVIENATNEGFMRATNAGLRQVSGEYVLLVNADAFVDSAGVEALAAFLDEHPEAAAVGPRLEYEDGRWQRWTAGREPTLRSVARFYLLYERLDPRSRPRSVYLERDVEEPFRPDWVSSACLLVRRRALDQVGMLDETYFCYMDDVDLCRRLRSAGWEIWYLPSVQVTHVMGGGVGRSRGRASPAAIQNFNHYFERHHGAIRGRLLRLVEIAGFAVRAAACGVVGLLRRDPSYRQATIAHAHNIRHALRRGYV